MSDQSQGRGWWMASDGKWYPPESHPRYGAARLSARIKAYAGIGLALVLAAVLVVSLGNESGSDAPEETRSSAIPDVDDLRLPLRLPESRPLPTATLTVFSDGCGVIRSDLPDEPHGLTWSIIDADGFQVLGRNATNETRYRYFQAGTYTVVLTAWDGSSYVPISNTVTIHC